MILYDILENVRSQKKKLHGIEWIAACTSVRDLID